MVGRLAVGPCHVVHTWPKQERAQLIESAMLGCMVDPLEAPLLQSAASMQRVWAFVSLEAVRRGHSGTGPRMGARHDLGRVKEVWRSTSFSRIPDDSSGLVPVCSNK